MTEQSALPFPCATCRGAQAAHLLVFDGGPVGMFCPPCADRIVAGLVEHPGPPGTQVAVHRYAFHPIPTLPTTDKPPA